MLYVLYFQLVFLETLCLISLNDYMYISFECTLPQTRVGFEMIWPVQRSMRGHCVLFWQNFQFCNGLPIVSLCLWRHILHLLELGFSSLKGNLTQTRRAIASVTIHSKGSIWDQFVFHMAKHHICVHTLYINYYFWRYSILFLRNFYD